MGGGGKKKSYVTLNKMCLSYMLALETMSPSTVLVAMRQRVTGGEQEAQG